MNSNLHKLLHALFIELERMEWEDEIELAGLEVDMSFDYHGEFCEDCHDDSDMDSDLPDETDHVGWPLCVECGNFSPSCVC